MEKYIQLVKKAGLMLSFLLMTTSLIAQGIQVKGVVKDPAGEVIIGAECSSERY